MIYYGDIDLDFDDGFVNGVYVLFDIINFVFCDDVFWGSIVIWVWGLSVVFDYLE